MTSVHPATGSATGLSLLAHHGLGGYGDGMQVLREGDALYVGHTGTTGMGTSILDVSDPVRPVLVTQWYAPARAHTHKVQAAGGLLLVNHEKFPYRAVMSEPPVSRAGRCTGRGDPLHPEQVAFWPSGGRGVHRVVWTGGRYAHLSAIPDGFGDRIWVVLDLSDPEQPSEAARCGGGRGSATARPRRGRRASGTPRTTRCSRGTAPISATTTPAWWYWTSPT